MNIFKRYAAIGFIAGLSLTAAPAAPFAADLFPGYGSAVSGVSADLDVSIPSMLVSTPSYPANASYFNIAKPVFAWVGISTTAAAALGYGAVYTLQVDDNSDFSSVAVLLSTPVAISGGGAATANAAITLSTHTLAEGTTWYWRVFTQVGALSGPYSSTSSFVTDFSSPSVTGFLVKSSTGGWLGESQWIGLAAGVTAQVSVQDPGSGLAVSTSALWSGGDGHDWGDLTSGFSVKYTSNSGTNWVEGAGWAASNGGTPVVAGEAAAYSLAVYNGKLYAGTRPAAKAAVFDGTLWSAANGGNSLIAGEAFVESFAVYNGKLYAGTYPGSRVAVFDGASWSAANGGNALIAGETDVYSLAVYNGKLYAGTGGNGKVAVFDGTTWSAANDGSPVLAGVTAVQALAVYNGKLYAGTGASGKVAVFDGTTWSDANGGNAVIAGEAIVYSLAVFNGKLYAGTIGAKVAVFDGTTWSATNGGSPVISGGAFLEALAAYNGKLYAGAINGKVGVFDGVVWSAANGDSPVLAGETNLRALAVYNGNLFAGLGNTKVAVMSPLGASLAGSDGTKSSQTLAMNGNLTLAQSQNGQLCGGFLCSARNQVVFSASDLAGNVKTYGPYAVLVDTTPPPQPTVSAYQAHYTSVTASIGAVTDPLSGIQGYNFELSEASDFGVLTASTGYVSQTDAAFTGLVEATTYYVRATPRDNALNIGAVSAYISTMTPGMVNVSTQNAAPSVLMQGTSSVFLIFDLATSPGRSTTLNQVRLAKTGTLPDADIASVYIYRDNGDAVYGAGDTLAGSAVVVSGTATVTLTPQAIDSAGRRFFALYSLSAGAGLGKTFGARLASASSLVFPYPFGAAGQLPASSTLATVSVDPTMLISTPSYPVNGSLVNIAKPGFAWVGMSTIAAAGLGAGANYTVQIDNNGDFSSVEVLLSTPVIIGSTSELTASGSIELSTHTLADDTIWYWRVFAQGAGVTGQYSSVSNFVTDLSSPSITGFQVKSATGGWVSEGQWIGLNAGVTVQASVQDLVTGLAVSTSSLWGGGDGHDWGDLTSGFSVKYTSNSGTNWAEGAGWAASNAGSPLIAGETQIAAFAAYAGKLYSGTAANGKVAVFDGNTWSPSNGSLSIISGETQINSLAVYNGNLYAGTAPNGKVAVFNGTIWSPANGGSPLIAGATSVYSLAVYGGRLYAGTGGGGKVAVFDGSAWSVSNGGNPVITAGTEVSALSVYNGRLYAGTSPGAKVAVFDGNTWSPANGGNAVVSGATKVYSLAVYNGTLYAGTGGGGKAAVFDGNAWSAANGGSAVLPGATYVQSLAVYNGKLYAGTSPGGKAAVFDGAAWSVANGGSTVIAGETQLQSLAVYNGKLYAGASSNGKVSVLSPLNVSLGGSDGTKTAQTLTVNGAMTLAQSQSGLICNGSVCGARNQVVFNAADLAGNVRTYGPYAVLVDTTGPPQPSVSSYQAYYTSVAVDIGAVTDPLSGTRDYNYELSELSNFSVLTASSDYITQTSNVFGGLTEATTYYARVSARDNVLNVSQPSVYITTMTPAIVNVSTWNAAPGGLMQGTSSVFLIFDLATSPGRSTTLSQVRLAKTGTLADADITSVHIYRDTGDGVYGAADSLAGSALVVSGTATVDMAQAINSTPRRFFALYSLSAGASIGKTIGALLEAASSLAFPYPFSATGQLPASSGLAMAGVNPAVLISTPSYPADNVYVSTPKPALTWVGISTVAAAALGAGANYTIQIDNNSDFSSVEVALSTPVVIGSTSALTANGAIELSTHTLADDTTWYWRVFVQSGELAGPYSSVANFATDLSLPSISGFAVKSSTGGWLAESQWIGLGAGVTVQASVQDLVSGLAVSTSALLSGGDGHDWGDLTSGFSVKYTTTAGTNWIEGDGWAAANGGLAVIAGETEVRSLAVYNGKLYAGSSGGKVAVFDGAGWSAANGGLAVVPGAIQAPSLAVYNGKLYAGTKSEGKAAVYDGTTWSAANGGQALIAGETGVASFAVYNGKLYAGTSPGGKVAVFDGTTWSAANGGSAVAAAGTEVNSLSVYNGRLYAGTAPGAKVAVFDGKAWSASNGGSAIISGATNIFSFAVYNGRLYAGTYPEGKVTVFDGISWSAENGGLPVIAGATEVGSFAVYSGKLYAGTHPGGKVAVFDGSAWSAANSGNPVLAGATPVDSLAVYDGKLYAGTRPNAQVAVMSPLSAAISGPGDGAKTAQTITVNGALNLAQSQSNLVCNGSVCAALNQVVFNASDLAGNVRTYGPYAVLVDSAPPPQPSVSAYQAYFTSVTASVGAVTDPHSGMQGYNFEFSEDPDFSVLTASTGYLSQTSAVFPGLVEATTYYLRASARDNVLNASQPSVYITTMTAGIVNVSTWNAAPAGLMQGTSSVFLIFDLATSAGRSTALNQVRVAKTGTLADADISAAHIYRDNGDTVFGAGDVQIGAAAVVSGTASVTVTPTAITSAPRRFFVLYSLSAGASVGKTLGARLAASSSLVFPYPFGAAGQLPASSGLAIAGVNPAVLISTPSYPAGGVYVNGSKPSLTWVGISTIAAAALGAGANYSVQIDNNSDFSSVEVALSTPVLIGSVSALTANGSVDLSTHTLADGATWYWRVLTQGGGVDGPNSSAASFVTDLSLPSVSGFAVKSSTGGWLGESQWTGLSTGVTVQVSVLDLVSGLAVSTSSLWGGSDGHAWSDQTSGYSVKYTTNAGAGWTEGAGWTVSNAGSPVIAGETEVRSFAVYGGKLYAGTGAGGKVAVFDGNTWLQSNGGNPVISGESQVNALAVYGGDLYAGTGPGAKVAVYNGTTWSPANGGSAVIAGESAVYSLAVYNGKLYAGTSTGGKVAVFDGTAWSATNAGSPVIPGVQYVFSLAVYNGKLYAGTYPGGRVAVFDGNTWNAANGGNPVVAGASQVLSLAVYGGRLYAGTNFSSKAAVFDGATWSAANGGSALIAGGTDVQSLAVYNGKLYAGTSPGGKAAVFDGTTWSAANGGGALVAGESQAHSLAVYNGKLYAGTFSGGRVAELSPLSATLSGEDGTNAAQTLTVNGALNLVQSQSNLVCNGSVCGARNQVVFNASDLAGNVKTYGPYAVLMDTTPPSVSIQSFSVSTFTLTLAASGSDPLSGFKDYHFEVSSAADFGSGVSSTGYTAQNSAVFADMSEATTYYARVSARDNVDNISGYSVSASTLTRGFVYVSSSGAAPADVLQGADAVMMSLVMATNPGRSAALSRVVLARTGTSSASDIAAVKIYRDNNGDGLLDEGDTLFGASVFSGANASVTLSPTVPVGEVQTRLLVVYNFVSGAAVGKTAGVSLDSASKLVFADPYAALGSFPLGSSLSTIQDGVNRLDIAAVGIAPGSVPPGQANVPMIKLVMNTDVGTSLVDSLNVLLAGNMTSGNISAVKLYLDTNGNAEFDFMSDELLSSGSDPFLNYSSTITLSAPAEDRTVGTVLRYMFVVVDVGADAPEGAKFSVVIPTAAAFTLHNPGDTPAMTPSAFTSDQVTVQTRNTANIYAQTLIPAELVQGELYAVALASVSVNLGIAELNRVNVSRLGDSLDSDIKSVRIYRDQVLDGGNFNRYFDFFLGSGTFSGGLASINITTETISAGATTQLFIVYEVSPSAMPGNTVGARFTNVADFRMSSAFTTVYGNFPYNTATAPLRATVNPFKISAAMDVTSGELFHGATNSRMLRLDVKSEFNPVNWTSLRVKKLGTVPDALVDAVKLYRDSDGDGLVTPGTDELVTDGADVFSGGEVTLAFSRSQSVSGAGGAYFITLDIDPDAPVDLGYTAGVEVTTTSWFTINSPNYISTASVAGPYQGGPSLIKQYPNIVTVSTANIMPSAGAYPGDLNVPVFKMTLKTDISTAKLLNVRFTKTGTLTDAEVKAVKVYYDLNNRGTFDPGNVSAYLLATPSTVTFGTDGQPGSVTLGLVEEGRTVAKAGSSYFVVLDLQDSAVVGRSLTMRVSDSSNFTVSAPNSVAPAAFSSPPLYVRATAQVLSVAFDNKLSTFVVQGQTSVLVASFTVTASSYSIDLSRIDLGRGGNGVDGDISAIRLYRDNGNGTWGGIEETLLAEGVFSGGRVSFSPAVQTIQYPVPVLYYVAADISETASNGSTFGVAAPAGGYFGVNEPHAVSSSGLPFYSQLAVIQPTVDNLVVAGIDSAPSIAQGESNKVMGRLRMKADTRSALVSSVRFDKAGTTPDADIVRLRLYKDNGDLVFGAGDQLAGTLNAFSSGFGVMVVSPSQSVGTGFADYFVTADISTLAAINTSFSLQVTPAVVAPDALTITGTTITFTMAGTISDRPDTVYMHFTDIASQSLYVGVADNQLARLSFWTDNDVAYLTGFKLSFAGLAGPSDIPLVKIYRDTDGNGYFDTAVDALAATAQLTAGYAYLYLPGSGDTVSASTRTYFAAVDIASGAAIGNTASLGIPNENSLFVSGSDRVAVFPGQATITATIRDPLIPTPPEISIYRADGRLHPRTNEAFTAYRTLLKFKWYSVALQGSVEQAYYYIGPQPAGDSTPAGSWTACGASPEVSIRGLTLLNNGIYYLSVRVKNSAGAYYSDIVSRRFVVDTVVPALGSSAISLVTEGSDRIISWSRAEGGASGIEYYVVEERRGNSPVWVALSTTSALFMSVSGSGVTLSEIARSPGAYYYRIYPVNGAGLAGAASEALAVNIGLEKLAAISDASVYPNPFDSRRRGAQIAFTLNTGSEVSVTIYDVFGNKVKRLAFAGIAGANSIAWDGTDSSGRKVSKGIYLCVIRAAGDSKVLKAGVIH